MYKRQLDALGLPNQSSGHGAPRWRMALLQPFVDAVVTDPDMPPSELFRAIEAVPQRPSWDRDPALLRRVRRANQSPERSAWHRERVQIVRAAAHRFASESATGHRSWRLRFRCFDWCIRFLHINRAMTPDVIEEFYRAVFINELRRGRPGVVARISWFLRLLGAEHGHDVAYRAAVAIKARRDALKRSQKALQDRMLRSQQALQDRMLRSQPRMYRLSRWTPP